MDFTSFLPNFQRPVVSQLALLDAVELSGTPPSTFPLILNNSVLCVRTESLAIDHVVMARVSDSTRT